MALNNENNTHVVVIPLGSIAAAGDLPGFVAPNRIKIKSAKLINNANISASDTDYAQVSLKNGSTVIAEMDTRAAHEGAVTALVGLGLNVVEADSVVEAGTSLKATYAEGGTMALTSAVLCVEYFNI